MLLTLIISALLCAVIYFDITRYIIPNWIVGLLLLSYPVAVYLSPNPVNWQTSIIVALTALGIGFVVYALKLMGGGDVKLLMACLLWRRPEVAFEYILYVAIWGGVLAVALWIVRAIIHRVEEQIGKAWKLPRILQVGAPVPYGVAIAGVFLYRLWTNQMFIMPIVHI